jgi:hypothetical protein
VVLDQPEGALGHSPPERPDGGPDVVGRVDRLADVVKQGGQEELLVVRADFARAFEDLEAVVEGVPLGVVLGVLLDGLKG